MTARPRTPEQIEKDRARSRAWHARQRAAADAWHRHGTAGPVVMGDLYDAIWGLELPTVDRVDSASVRMVLFAMARHLNKPKLEKQDYRVWPSGQRIAELIERSHRQVQRILDVLVAHELVAVVRPGLRPGRGRTGRPTIYRLCPERWPTRVLNGRDTGVAAIGDLAMVTTPVTDGDDTGVAKRHGDDTGVQKAPMATTPVSPESGKETGNPAMETGNPANEPGNPRERAREADQQNSEGRSDDAHTLGLPGGFSLSRLDGGPPGDLRAAEVWTAALELLRARVGEPIFGTYLADTEAEWFDATAAVLALTSANPFHVPWLEGKLAGVIDQAVREVVDRPVRVEWSKPREERPPVRPRPAPLVAAAVVS